MLVNGSETPYIITAEGEVFNADGHRMTKHLTHDGYYRVKLSIGCKRGMYRVNRLVAENYIPNPNNYPMVNHLDSNRTNNRVDNLEWCTNSQNQKHSYQFRMGTKAKTVYQLTMEGELIQSFPTPKIAEEKTGIARQNISKVARGIRNHAGGFKWSYNVECPETIEKVEG